jgi:hypothetical protein
MFICKGKCDFIGILTIIHFVICICLLFYYIICSYNNSHCNVILIFLVTFFSLFLIYLYFWIKNSTKKTKIHPIIINKKIRTIKKIKKIKKKYIFFKQETDRSFDQIII